MAYDKDLADRLRHVLGDRPGLVEKKMMGALCFMVGGHMCCGVTGAALMIRVGKEHYAAALAAPHVRPLEMGGRRPGGFVLVDPAGFAGDAALAAWVRRGLEFVATLPAKDRA